MDGVLIASEAHDSAQAGKLLDKLRPVPFQTRDTIAASGRKKLRLTNTQLGSGVANASFRAGFQQGFPTFFQRLLCSGFHRMCSLPLRKNDHLGEVAVGMPKLPLAVVCSFL